MFASKKFAFIGLAQWISIFLQLKYVCLLFSAVIYKFCPVSDDNNINMNYAEN